MAEASTMLCLPDLSRLTLHTAPVGTYPLTPRHELTAQEVYDLIHKYRDEYLAFYQACSWKTVDDIKWFLDTSRPEIIHSKQWLEDRWWVNDATYQQDQVLLEDATAMHKQAFLLRRWIGVHVAVKEIHSKLEEVRAIEVSRVSQNLLDDLQRFITRQDAALAFFKPFTAKDVTAWAGGVYERFRQDVLSSVNEATDELEVLRKWAEPLWKPDFQRSELAALDSVVTFGAAHARQRAAAAGPGSSNGRTPRRELAVGMLDPPMQLVFEKIQTALVTAKKMAREDRSSGSVVVPSPIPAEAGLGSFTVEARRRSTGDVVDGYVSWSDAAGNPISIAKSGIDIDWRWGNKLRSEPEIINFLDWLWSSYLSADDKTMAKTWTMAAPKRQ